MTDQTAELQGLIDGATVDFGGAEYSLEGQVVIPRGKTIKNLRAVVPNWDANRRVFLVIDATGVEIDGLYINIGDDPSKGNLTTSQALDVTGGRNASLKNIEVTGKGRGTMIRLFQLYCSTVEDIWCHDGQHDNAGGAEQIIGLWAVYCRKLAVNRPRVARLLNDAGRAYGTDGITVSGSVDLQINDAIVERVGEGIDVSGSAVNVRVDIDGATIIDPDSFGIKYANASQCCTTRDSTVIRAGYAAYEYSGMSEAGNSALHYGNKLLNCFALDMCVGNSNWAAQNTAGVRIEQGSYLTSYPRDVFVDGLTVTGAHKYGALTQINSANTLRNFKSEGETVAEKLGTWLS